MATVTRIASAGTSSASATLTTAATITAAVGDWLLVAIAVLDRAAGSSFVSINDSDGINTYTTRVNINYSPAGDFSGADLILITAPVTDALTNATITTHWTPYFGTGAYQVFRIQPGAGEAISFVAADTTGSTGSATLHSAPTVSVALGNIIFGAAALETNIAVTGDSDTSNGSWSALSTEMYPNATDTLGFISAVQWKTVTGTGNQSWSCSTTSAKDSARSYLVLHLVSAAYSLTALGGAYTLNGVAATMRKSMAPIVAGPGSYTMTGTAVTLTLPHSIAASAGSYTLLGTDANTLHGWKSAAGTDSYALTGTAATPIASTSKRVQPDSGSYTLTGTDAVMVPSHLVVADAGSYTLSGTTAPVLHAWRLAAGAVTIDELLVQTGYNLLTEDGLALLVAEQSVGGSYALTGSDVALNASTGDKTVIADAGSYALTGTAATLTLATAPKSIVAESGSYLLTGTAATLTPSAQPLAPSPLHIGEWPIDKRRRRRREDAAAAEQRARKRFRDAIGRLLEGLPPEFDEPIDLDEALDSAVQASNLLYALSAPIREINAVNELIDHIRQLRIAQPIAQLHLAQAYNQAHRHLMAKAQEDTVMALLLGE